MAALRGRLSRSALSDVELLTKLESIDARVVDIADGDTIEVSVSNRKPARRLALRDPRLHRCGTAPTAAEDLEHIEFRRDVRRQLRRSPRSVDDEPRLRALLWPRPIDLVRTQPMAVLSAAHELVLEGQLVSR
jgi:endonuclease YncB( thermonuclease family)